MDMAHLAFKPCVAVSPACRGTMADAINASRCSGDGENNLPPYTVPEIIVIAILAGTLSFVTVIGNSMVMISFKIDRQLQTISNYFLFSLAVADLAIGLISMPLFTVSTLLGYWPLGRHICDTWLALDYLASNASVLNLLIISFDRYFSVTRPLTYRAKRTTGKAAIMIAGAWGISLLLWPPWIYAWPYIEGKRTVPETECYIQFIETNHYITFGTAIAAFYIPVSVMIVLYYRIWRETKKRQKDLPNLLAGRSSRSSIRRRQGCDLPVDDIRRLRYGSGVDFYPRKKKYTVLTWDWCKHCCLTWWHSGREDASFEYETASDIGVGTPSSMETPLPPSVSRTTSFITDPYGPSTSSGQFVTHPQVHWRGPPSTVSTPTQTPSTPIIDGRAVGEELDPAAAAAAAAEAAAADEALANSKGAQAYARIPDGDTYTVVIQLPKLNEEGEPDPEDKPSVKLFDNQVPQRMRDKFGIGTSSTSPTSPTSPTSTRRPLAPSYRTERKDAATDTEEDLNQITPSPGSTLGRRPSTIPEKIPYILPKTIIRGPKKKGEKKQDKKAARTLTAILLSFIITWTPYNVLVLLKPVTSGYTCIPQQLWDFFYYLCYINSTINPVCYALCNASFRRTYVRILTCRWRGRERVGVNRSALN